MSEKQNEWKEFDIQKAVLQDVIAASSLLRLIAENPEILLLVTKEIEKIRERIIKQQAEVENQPEPIS